MRFGKHIQLLLDLSFWGVYIINLLQPMELKFIATQSKSIVEAKSLSKYYHTKKKRKKEIQKIQKIQKFINTSQLSKPICLSYRNGWNGKESK